MEPGSVAFLACGWSLASERTHGTAVAVREGSQVALVDAGGGVAKELVRLGADGDLDRVYLTHEHPDHTWGLPGLVHHLRFTDRERPLVLRGPGPALDRARAGLRALGVTCPFELSWEPLEAGAGGDGWARWAPVDHGVEALAYRFGDVTVVADTRPAASVVELARGSSLLTHEASHDDAELCHETGHATPADAGEIAAEADVDTLALLHVHPDLGRQAARRACGFPDTLAPADGHVAERTADGWVLA